MTTRNLRSSVRLKALIDQLGKAAEGAATNKDLNVGLLKELRFKAKDLSSTAAEDRCQLPKARVTASEGVVHLWDERKDR